MSTTVTATTSASSTCTLCEGTGWADPWDLGDDTPQLVACDRCLGFGLADCPDCEGEGTLAPPRPCPCQQQAAA